MHRRSPHRNQRRAASRCGTSSSTSAPRAEPTSTTKWCIAPLRISVSARSKPRSATGPVFIETQKQVPPAWPHCTATMNKSSVRATVGRIGVPPAERAPGRASRSRAARTTGRRGTHTAAGPRGASTSSLSAPSLVDPRLPQLHLGGQLVLLPRVRADRVAEQRLVISPSQPVAAPVLLVGPPDREILGGGDLVVDDRPILGSSARRSCTRGLRAPKAVHRSPAVRSPGRCSCTSGFLARPEHLRGEQQRSVILGPRLLGGGHRSIVPVGDPAHADPSGPSPADAGRGD